MEYIVWIIMCQPSFCQNLKKG